MRSFVRLVSFVRHWLLNWLIDWLIHTSLIGELIHKINHSFIIIECESNEHLALFCTGFAGKNMIIWLRYWLEITVYTVQREVEKGICVFAYSCPVVGIAWLITGLQVIHDQQIHMKSLLKPIVLCCCFLECNGGQCCWWWWYWCCSCWNSRSWRKALKET